MVVQSPRSTQPLMGSTTSLETAGRAVRGGKLHFLSRSVWISLSFVLKPSSMSGSSVCVQLWNRFLLVCMNMNFMLLSRWCWNSPKVRSVALSSLCIIMWQVLSRVVAVLLSAFVAITKWTKSPKRHDVNIKINIAVTSIEFLSSSIVKWVANPSEFKESSNR